MKFIPSDLIKRPVYLERIKPFINKRIIKVLTGQRRVGKSYLLFQIMAYIQDKNPDASIIYINKEDLTFSHLKNSKDLNDYIQQQSVNYKTNYVFIDEIQDIENFQDALRSLLLDENIDLYCTGSNANLLSGDIAGVLSGRFIETKVYSLSYVEFLNFHQLKNQSKSLELYMKYGGLPYLKHLPLEDEVVFEYLKNIYTTILYRDIINRYNIRKTSLLEKLVIFLADNTGSLFSAKKISDFLKSQHIKIAPNQVQQYIFYLVSSFIIHEVKRFDIKGKKIFEINDKYYFENLGIRNAIWGYRLQDRGKIMENMVYNHLIFLNYEVKVGKLSNKEIDFIAEKNANYFYFQVALSINNEKTLKREFENLMAIGDNYPKYIITMEKFEGVGNKGIKCIDLKSFLNLNKLS